MARNLRAKLPADDTLIVYDIDKARSQAFVDAAAGSGISAAVGPQQVQATFSEILAPDSPLPELHGQAPPRLFIDCSTIDPTTSREVARQVTSTPCAGQFIDAPMSGGVVGAEKGTLSFMMGHTPVAAHPDLRHRAEAALLLMGAKVWHMGDQGAGLAAKLINNYVLSIVNIATSEAMVMGQALKLDPARLSAMLASSTGSNWSNNVNNPVPGVNPAAPASRGYAGGFGIELMRKDMGLFQKEAERVAAELWLLDRVTDVYRTTAQSYPNRDFSVVYQMLKERQPPAQEQE
ncbi:hypothetical protein KEM52_000975 [Ascosphaera acerosa]|nr:hypothetical protein KEM52_000975 [Ascosphaera acerosa]